MSPPAKTCRTCAWYHRANIARDLPTHGSCWNRAPGSEVRPMHANSRACAQWSDGRDLTRAASGIARAFGLTPPEETP